MLHAMWSVQGLYFLAEADDAYFTGGHLRSETSPDVVDLAHARWATGSAMTALDLVAAAIGERHMPSLGGRLYDLGEFGRGKPKPNCQGCARWLATAASRSGWLKTVRDDMIHRAPARWLHAGVGTVPDDIRPWRTGLLTSRSRSAQPRQVGRIVLDCRDLSFELVRDFLVAVRDGTV